MNSDDQHFYAEMIRKLDQSERRLTAEEHRLARHLGDLRVGALLRYWLKELPETEAEAFKQSLSHDDKKLTWIWFRLKRIYLSRAKATRELMKLTI